MVDLLRYGRRSEMAEVLRGQQLPFERLAAANFRSRHRSARLRNRGARAGHGLLRT
jgi:hypothetical protein